MAQMRTIEIDFNLHKKIEMERQSFLESENEVLKRLLGIEEKIEEATTAAEAPKNWSNGKIYLPHGTMLRMNYNGREYNGMIDDGSWHVNGENYRTPSGAAIAVAKTKDGKSPSLNGKNYWYVKRPQDSEWNLFKNLEN